MLKIIIAPDKFKSSITGLEFCNIIERNFLKHLPNSEIIKLPLADGGDGTIEVLNYYLKGEFISIKAKDPLFRTIDASYLFSSSKKTAYIEMAEISGLKLLKKEEQNHPLKTSSYGTGELIKDAINRGAEHIILGIGGSATNDAGTGMARALGYRFFDINNTGLKGMGKDLIDLAYIDQSQIHPKLKTVKFEVACDVNNPLFGSNGAAYIYAAQKGASKEMIKKLDDGLINFSTILKTQYKKELHNIPGAGAAGGVGAGSLFFLNAQLISGIELIKKVADFDEKIENADWVITGEGKLDDQTFYGKVIGGIANSLNNQKMAIFCGTNTLSNLQLKKLKVTYITEIKNYAQNNNDSIINASNYLEQAVNDFIKTQLINSIVR